MDAIVKWQDGMKFVGESDSGFSLTLDADPSVGGNDEGFRPLELMLMSLIGCTSMDVISILRKKRQDVTGFEVSAHAEKAPDFPKVFTAITIVYKITGNEIDSAAVERSIELSKTKYCPAQTMLGQVVPIELEYEIIQNGKE
jgi:putative redox protein